MSQLLNLNEDEVKAVKFKINHLASCVGDELTEWEIDFLASIEERVTRPKPRLTENQLTYLDELWSNH
jgi:hypothetical protein